MTRRYGSGTTFEVKRRDPHTGLMVPTGKWAAQWSAGLDEYGERIRGSTSGHPSKAAAERAMADARGRSSSTKRKRGGETVAAFLARWLDTVVTKDRRERTLVGYRSIVTHHLVPAFGDRPVVSLNRREVQAWIDGHTVAPLTIRHHLDCLRAAMTYAVRWGLTETNPAKDIDLPSVTKRVVRAMSPEDAKALLVAVEGTWFAPLVTVALYTGLRQGELLGLRWEDVNLPGASLTVHHSLARLPGTHGTRFVLDAPKSAHSRRTVPLAAPAVAALRDARKASLAGKGNEHGLVFARADGRPIDGTALTREFQSALIPAKIAKLRWHDLRHATASLLIAQGVPLAVVSSILGHSGIGITVDVYGHLTEDTKRVAMDQMAANMAALA